MKKLMDFIKTLPWRNAFKAAAQILVPAAVGSTAAILAGCGSLTPSNKTQKMSLLAIGIPGIAVVTQATQNADNTGDDDNKPVQANPVTVKPTIK